MFFLKLVYQDKKNKNEYKALVWLLKGIFLGQHMFNDSF